MAVDDSRAEISSPPTEEELQRANALRSALSAEVSRAFIGPAEIAEQLLTALVARGHVLLEGIPGVAKTTLVKAFSKTLGCSFRRIQFTPDLLPSDITGTYILDMRSNSFVLRNGPIFSNVVLGDEINRAPAKSQSALLEAMQEAQVTIDGDTQPLKPPFIVLATQNPIEHEGTYPLPEAQIDRFLLKLVLSYPSPDHERQMLLAYSQPPPEVRKVLDPEAIIQLQRTADLIHIDAGLVGFILRLADFSRKHPKVFLGVSPRAALMLLRAAKARALLHGRAHVLPDDIKMLAVAVLAHRVILVPEAELEDFRPEEIIGEALKRVSHHTPARQRPQ